MNTKLDIFKYLNKIKTQSPVIHNITNLVVMSSSANILLALGASPIMAHCESEIEEIVAISSGLVLNIGTLDKMWIETMIKAAKVANQLKVPVVLDAVGAGATKLRTNSVRLIMDQCDLSVLRGNASEIYAVSSSKNFEKKTKGVDSAVKTNKEIINFAEKMAISNSCVIAISGPEDIVTDGLSTVHILNGHPIMTKVTGMGCGLTAFICAFCAVNSNIYNATVAASALYGICGDLVSKNYGNKPGSFFEKFIDTIYIAETMNLSELIKIYKTK